jgi:hypothetical protein
MELNIPKYLFFFKKKLLELIFESTIIKGFIVDMFILQSSIEL